MEVGKWSVRWQAKPLADVLARSAIERLQSFLVHNTQAQWMEQLGECVHSQHIQALLWLEWSRGEVVQIRLQDGTEVHGKAPMYFRAIL